VARPVLQIIIGSTRPGAAGSGRPSPTGSSTGPGREVTSRSWWPTWPSW